MKHIYRNSFLSAIAVWLVGVFTAFVCLKVARPSAEKMIAQSSEPYLEKSHVSSINYGYQWDWLFHSSGGNNPTNAFISRKMFDEAIHKQMLNYATRTAVTDRRIAQNFDIVRLDYIVTKDSKVISVRNNIIMHLGGNEYDPLFTEQLIGTEIGKTKVFTYCSDELGETATYTIEATLLEIWVDVIPELTDEFVQLSTPYQTVTEFQQAVYSDLKTELLSDKDRQTVKRIAARISRWSDYQINRQELLALCEEIEELREELGLEYRINQAYDLARQEICTRIVLDAVAKEEGFTVSAEEIAAAGSEAEALRAKAAEYLLDKFG